MDRAVNHWGHDQAHESHSGYSEPANEEAVISHINPESQPRVEAPPVSEPPMDPFAGGGEPIVETAMDTAELGIPSGSAHPQLSAEPSDHDLPADRATSVVDRGDEPSAKGVAGDARLAQIRELIVGDDLRNYEQRFEETEKRLVAMMSGLQSELLSELSGLRHSIEPRLSAVERELAARSEDVAKAVSAAEGAVENRVREMRIEFIGYRKTLEQTIGQVEERVAKGGRQLAQEIAELRRQSAQEMADMGTEVTRRLDLIEAQSADRAALGKGLADLARTISGEVRTVQSEAAPAGPEHSQGHHEG